ncbi:hypothetical protein J437_LFUL018858 [Ladona fulva]|uniref:Protein-lysine N-methyltransferase J437_LFUL018858 n=1 Tax=Ladona fulva TaxID=123851 RepID=A0A8K0PAM7_LADFU|nr:hypothetical protein J437_LFUL018858 [Ladona fulva]
MSDSDDDIPKLSKETLAALNEFYAEREREVSEDNEINEDWVRLLIEIGAFQLSQFWYDETTTEYLTDLVIKAAGPKGKIALLSCPTVYPVIKSRTTTDETVYLFEYDERFSKYGDDFIAYDYNKPLNVPKDFSQIFDVVMLDPPFLSEECLCKVAETVKFLTSKKIILCTGAVMEELAVNLLNVRKIAFEPKHKNNLANEFFCYTNFETSNV